MTSHVPPSLPIDYHQANIWLSATEHTMNLVAGQAANSEGQALQG
jgi:hypothetical protein